MNQQQAHKIGFSIAKTQPTCNVGTVGIPWEKFIGLISYGQNAAAQTLLTDLLERNVDWLQKIAANITKEANELNKELFSYLAKCPELLRNISPREFEKIIFEILLDRGFDVQLTPMTHDGGRDILAVFKSPSKGSVLTIVQCKRFKQKNPVGIAVVREFLYVMKEEDKAKYGIIATTSYFSRDTKPIEKKWSNELKLRDFNHLVKWLKDYGQWKGDKHTGLWIPDISAL
jgi:restriction endonuclease Mrr